MKNKLRTLCIALAFSGLWACSANVQTPVGKPTGPVTQAEVDAVFDLIQIGEKSYDVSGNMYLGKRPVEAKDLTGKSYGRTFNFLGLSQQVMDALPSDVRNAALDATPEQLGAFLSQQGLTIADVRTAQVRGTLESAGVKKLFALSEQRVGKTSINVMLAQRLVSILGAQ